MGYPLTSCMLCGDLKTIYAKDTFPKRYGHFWPHRPLKAFYDPNNMYHHSYWKTNISRAVIFLAKESISEMNYIESLLMGFRQISSYLPKQVPANKFLLAGTVPANNLFLKKYQYNIHPSKYTSQFQKLWRFDEKNWKK